MLFGLCRFRNIKRRFKPIGNAFAPRIGNAYLVSVCPGEEEVERNRGDEIDEEPPFQVVHGYLPRVRHNLVIAVDVCRTEVYQDVDDEGDVHCRKRTNKKKPEMLAHISVNI